jgi:hypothetical protein
MSYYPNVYASQTGPLLLSGLDANFNFAVDIQSQSLYAAAGGSADVITATYTPAVTALVSGLTLYVSAAYANATTTPTFSPNGLTAQTIKKFNNQALAVGDIVGAGHVLILQYDATNSVWVLANPSYAQVPTNTFGFKNRIINGAFNVQQYLSGGIGGTGLNGGYVTDRWYAQINSTTAGGVTPSVAAGTLPSSSIPQNVLTLSCTLTGSTQTLSAVQRIEAINVQDLYNATVTVSGYFATSNSSTVSWAAYYPNTTDTYPAGNITSGTTFITGSSFSTTSSLAYKTFSFNVGSNAPSKGLMIVFNATFTSTLQNMSFTGVQLEKGSVATSFDYRPYSTELTLASRYYGAYGCVAYTSAFTYSFPPRTIMRATPTVAYGFSTGTGGVWSFTSYTYGGGQGSVYQSTAHSVTSQAYVTLNSEL